MTYKLTPIDSQTIDFLDESGRSVASFFIHDGTVACERTDEGLRRTLISVMEIAALLEFEKLKAV